MSRDPGSVQLCLTFISWRCADRGGGVPYHFFLWVTFWCNSIKGRWERIISQSVAFSRIGSPILLLSLLVIVMRSTPHTMKRLILSSWNCQTSKSDYPGKRGIAWALQKAVQTHGFVHRSLGFINRWLLLMNMSTRLHVTGFSWHLGMSVEIRLAQEELKPYLGSQSRGSRKITQLLNLFGSSLLTVPGPRTEVCS